MLNKARIIGYRLAMAVREIVEIEWDVLSNLETGKSFVVAIILHHEFLLCCAISAQFNCMKLMPFQLMLA